MNTLLLIRNLLGALACCLERLPSLTTMTTCLACVLLNLTSWNFRGYISREGIDLILVFAHLLALHGVRPRLHLQVSGAKMVP